MLRPSRNDETLWLHNDGGCRNPPNVPTCSGQQLYAFLLSRNIPMLNLIKCRMFVCWLFSMIITCVLFMYFCQKNKFLQSFLTNFCLEFKCSKLATTFRHRPWLAYYMAMLYAAISARFLDV